MATETVKFVIKEISYANEDGEIVAALLIFDDEIKGIGSENYLPKPFGAGNGKWIKSNG